MDESFKNTALVNYFDNTEMTESSMTDKLRDTSMTEKRTVAGPSIAGEIISNFVEFVNYFVKEEKDKNTGASSMSEKRIDSHPTTAGEFTSSPVEIANDFDNVETKDKQIKRSKKEVSSMSKRVARPCTAAAFKRKIAEEESVDYTIAVYSMVPVFVKVSLEALDKCDEADGISLAQIKAYMGEKYKVHENVLKSQVYKYLRKGEERGIYVKFTGANGEDKFKIKKNDKNTGTSSMFEKRIDSQTTTAGQFLRCPVTLVNNSDNVEAKNKRIKLLKGEVSSMSKKVAGPPTAVAFNRKIAEEESVDDAIAVYSMVPLFVKESLKVLDKCDETDGVPLTQIKAYMREKYKVHEDVLKSQVYKYLRKGEEMGIYVKISGANGEDKFKIKK